jgi:hypothetical protein
MLKFAQATTTQVDLAAKLAAAQTAMAQAQEARQSAALEAELDPSAATAKAMEHTVAELRLARERLEAVQAALAEHAKRKAKHEEREVAADRVRRWKSVQEQCVIREHAAKDLEAAVQALVEPWDRLTQATNKIVAAAVIRDSDGALVRQEALSAALRVALARAGFIWASPWTLAMEVLPTLTGDVVAASAHIAKQRSLALAA